MEYRSMEYRLASLVDQYDLSMHEMISNNTFKSLSILINNKNAQMRQIKQNSKQIVANDDAFAYKDKRT